jgi:hypothetical protein
MRLLWRTVPALLAAAMCHPVDAAQNCGNQDLKGAYGAIATGSLVAAPLPPELLGPSTRVGRLDVDGKGNAQIKVTVSFNGAIIDEEYTGTYLVNPDCTMSMILNVPFPGISAPIPLTFFGALADEGRQISILIVDPPGAEIRIDLRRQEHLTCSTADVSGGYLVDLVGVNVFLPDYPPGVFARVGRLAFDGKGAFSANTQTSYNGLIVGEVFSGSYTVDSACKVQMQYTNGQPYSWVGFLTDNGAGAVLILNAPQGAVVSGTMTRQ